VATHLRIRRRASRFSGASGNPMTADKPHSEGTISREQNGDCGMLKTLKRGRAWIVGAVGLVALVWIVESSQSFQSCVQGAQYQGGEQTLQKRAANFSVLLRRRQDCLGLFVHQNEGAITALATIFIALFTLTLWRSSERLWEASENQRALSEKTAERQLRARMYFPSEQN
jgi:hypothetical protein